MSATNPILDYAATSPLPPYVPSSGAALDSSVVHNTGAESIAGVKTFTNPIAVVAIRDAAGRPREPIRALDYAAGDGRDDQAAILAAVTEAAARERRLHFEDAPSFYGLSSPVSLPDNTEISADHGAIIKARSDNASSVKIFSGSGKSGIKISGLTFDGNVGVVPDGAPLNQFFQCTGIKVESCLFQNVRGLCLNLSTNIVDFDILDCWFNNTGCPDGFGPLVTDASSTINLNESVAGNSHDVRIQGNRFYLWGYAAISLENVTDALISDNFGRHGNDALLYTQAGACRGLIITRNKVRLGHSGFTPFANGLDLVNLYDSIVSQNVAMECPGAGIGVFAGSDVQITGNICKNNYQSGGSFPAGIVLRNAAGTAQRIVVDGNICTDDQSVKTQLYGLLHDKGDGLIIGTNNRFQGNATAEVGIADGAAHVLGPDTDGSSRVEADASNWDAFAVANNGVGSLFNAGNNFGGMLLIQHLQTNILALFLCGDMGNVSLVGQSLAGATGSFSTTFDAANRNNFYWDGTAGCLRLQNKTGASGTYRIIPIRSSVSI